MQTSFEKSVSIAQLMGIKFYLNKFARLDNLEGYSLGTVLELNKEYNKFLEDSGGLDPDFPGIDFGGQGKKVEGQNKSQIENEGDGI